MLEFFASVYFLGIILMAGACCLFLGVFIPSWYIGHPRRFWITRLTYDNDKGQQSFVRLIWVLAWLFAFVGAFIIAFNDQRIPHTLWWISGQTCYSVLVVWLTAKIILAFCIFVQYISKGFMRLKAWISDDKPLFQKHKS